MKNDPIWAEEIVFQIQYGAVVINLGMITSSRHMTDGV